MDPQRQHAQLLELWAQGNKAFRRLAHVSHVQGISESERWWNLGRQIGEHGCQVLPFVGPSPALLISWAQETSSKTSWAALCHQDDVFGAEIFSRVIAIDWEARPALRIADGRFVVSADLARRLGRVSWTVLAGGPPKGSVSCQWEKMDEANWILAGLRKQGAFFKRAQVSDWLPLARLLRHRGIFVRVPEWPSGAPYPWVAYDKDSGRYAWPIQDEDSVHKRSQVRGSSSI